MHNFTNYTYNSTYANFSSTIMSDEFREYLDNQMFIPLIVLSWLFLITNHKYRQSLKAFESFKAQSADEIFFLQDSLARDDTTDENSIITDTLCPCCANAAVTTLPVSHPIAKCPRDTMMDAFCDEMITKMKALMKDKRATEEEYADMDGKWNSLCCCGGKLHGFGDPMCCKKW